MLLEQPRRRFSAEEVLRMLELGILDEDEPVELIDGELIEVSPQGPSHRGLTVVIRERLAAAFGEGFHLQDHSPIAASAYSMPEPDVAVIRGSARAFLDRHPAGPDIVLAVEISVTSQRLDRAKAGVYAEAGIETYWHMDLPARRLTVYTDPTDGKYRSVRAHGEGDAVLAGGVAIALADLLP